MNTTATSVESSSIWETQPQAYSLSYVVVLAVLIYCFHRPRKVYLMDFKCYQPPAHHRVTATTLAEHMELIGTWSQQSMDFQNKMIQRSGIGNHTCLPEGMHKFPMDHSLSATIHEIHTVFFQIVHNLLTENNVHPRAIDVIVTNCSLTSPTPSLASMVVNRFGFRSNVKAYNLSGMGCSAGILALHLARDVLNVHGNSLVLILSMESVAANFYKGDTKSMLLSNCLFRMGGAGALLSNRPRDRPRAKYELAHIVRTHLGANNDAYDCVMQQHDAKGHTGVALSRLITQVQ